MAEYQIKQLVFSSSCTVYGTTKELPVTELTPTVKADSPYGNTKKVGEEILRDTVNSGTQIKVAALRYFNPVGAHPSALIGELPIGRPNNLVPFITQTAAGLQKELQIFGDTYNTTDGSCVRDFIHVVDLAKAHIAALGYLNKSQQIPLLDVFNIGTGKGNSVLEMVHGFEKVTGLKLNYRIVDKRPGDVEQIYADTKKANEVLGWKSHLTIEDSLLDSWNWQKQLTEIKITK
jgi:UDP-glucose 4-epimerase